MAEVAPYGAWRSPITAEKLTEQQVGLGQPSVDGANLYWLESRPDEGGRTTLIQRLADGTRVERTPPPFNLRTRVHEYGGGAYAVRRGLAVGVAWSDQRLYRLQSGAPPVPLTPESDGRLRYADMAFDPVRSRVVAVREDHRGAGEPVNTLVGLSLDTVGEGEILADGHDFFASPCFSPDVRRLAWLSWDHPRMPWDGSDLWLAELDAAGRPGAPRHVAGGPAEAIVQPTFAPDGRLYFGSDRSGHWNIYRLEDAGEPVNQTPYPAEFGGPHWVFGQDWYAFADAGRLVGCLVRDGVARFWQRPAAAGAIDLIELPWTEYGFVAAEGERVVARAGAPDRPSVIIGLDLAGGAAVELAFSGPLPCPARYLVRPEPITVPSTDGRATHALFYAPHNPDFSAPPGELPPLLVRSHGGPTSRTTTELGLGIQFWTSRGVAVADVNYGGSTGYGRAYRERLRGQWGVVDVEDCAAVASALAEQGRVDPNRLAITGGSAGGYTTLAALAFTDRFHAGISRYGVSDLSLLAEETHKFESRYLDGLIGPYPERADRYEARSPLAHADRISCPVLFLQGLEDKVVPPNQAERMVEAMRANGVPAVYVAFEGEQHGFRKAETIRTAARTELAFLAAVFGFTPADTDLPPIDLAESKRR
jgi:dipeptidyl aminopeptidase/acylaminoacyl peptidase